MLASLDLSPAPSLSSSLMQELESALSSGSVDRRTEMLHRVTDLFVDNAAQLSENQTTLFDNVMTRLIGHIETRTLAELSTRLAPIPNAPAAVIRSFAYDDAIAVSGPVLSQSERLTDDDLIEIASTKSQAHLSHIAIRPRLSEAVTDSLVDHGDLHVATEVAGNNGARFSKWGMSKLVIMADGNDRLTETIGIRSDIPPHLFHQLLAQATEIARDKLMARLGPEAMGPMREILAGIAAQLGPTTVSRRAYAEAQRVVHSLSQDTELTKHRLVEFAGGNRIAELVAALSVLSGITIQQIDRLLHAPSVYGTMILCKALGIDWPVAEAIIRVRTTQGGAPSSDLEEARKEYPELSVPSAQRLLRFWRVRQTVTASDHAQHSRALGLQSSASA
jgi:uncharacterized protein (DUF2336 family)